MALTFPAGDNALLSWATNFKTLITAAPTTYGLTAALATAYGTTLTAYATALAACDPGVRSKSAVVAKNTAKATLKLASQQTANLINGTPSVTDAQKVALGIPPRATPTPIPAPNSAPAMEVVSVSGVMAKIRLHDATAGSKRGKPAGVIGASVFSYLGATPPADLASWKFEGNTGKVVNDIAFGSSTPAGAKVWFTAFWFNGRKQSGPACNPISTNLPGGSVSMAA